MKGLLKNNYLAVCSNVKVFSALMLALGIFTAAVISRSLVIGCALLSIVGFSIIAVTGIKKRVCFQVGKI